MTEPTSAELLARFRQDDPTAAEALFRRYLDRLIRLAHARLSQRLAARVEAEDIVQSAYRSFFRLAAHGRVSVTAPGDLWRLLAHLALRKISRAVRRHSAGRRAVHRDLPNNDLDFPTGDPDPAAAAALLDELRSVLAPLDVVHRQMVEMRLLGHEAESIATAVGRSPRTVRRTLASVGQELERRLHSPAPSSAEAAPLPVVSYADLILRRQVGSGGMGQVYQADQKSRPGSVAVKLLRKPLRRHTLAAMRFQEEANLLAQLSHPGIVSLHGIGHLPDGGLFLVMDWVEGTDLGRRRAAGPVALADAQDWLAQAADAIEDAHRSGIVHCDLKPSNLLIEPNGRVRVVDFGLARLLRSNDVAIGGTPGFAAPEQYDSALGPISPRTDVYGLASVLRHLVIERLPADLAAFLERCLSRSPEERPGSVAEIADRLRLSI